MDIEKYFSNFFNGTKNPSLEAMKFFMKEFGNPHLNLKFIHVAGTKGKGSVTEMLSNVLIKSGYKVGKFMSPHLIKYNERTSINNVNISDEELEKIINFIEPKLKEYNDNHETKVSLFELETTIAILYFYYKKVDIAILEVGLGGLYDCTNIIEKPIASIINTISFDHVNILGDSLEQIAKEKAGIIKENSNTIFCDQNDCVDNIIIETCKKQNNNLYMLDVTDVINYSYDCEFQKFDYENHKNVKTNLKGPKQIKNAILCLKCFDILNENGFNITAENINEGLSTIVHRARFETIYNNPKIIFDGAHNDSAIINFRKTLEMYYKNYKKVFIISLLRTKDSKMYLKEILKEENSRFIFTSGNNSDKFFSKEELYEESKNILQNKTKENKDFNQNEKTKELYKMELVDAIVNAKNNLDDTITFFIGSFYIYKDVITHLKN